MKEGYSKIRNLAIANAFSYMKIIEKQGGSIPRILHECREHGLPELGLIDFDGDICITNDTNELGEVLKLIRNNPKVKLKDTQKIAGVSLSTLRRIVAELKDNGSMFRKGNSRSGEWVVWEQANDDLLV